MSAPSSPRKRKPSASLSESPSRATRRSAPRTFVISDPAENTDEEDEDAPYDEKLDADADDEDDYLAASQVEADDAVQAVSAAEPSQQATSRPKRSRPAQTSYYAPLPSLTDDEQDDEEHDEAPSIRKRTRRPKLLTSDAESDTHPPTPSRVEPEAQREKTAEPTEEDRQRARHQKEEDDLHARWTDEYFEIVQQLPLEVHRSLALMRELEGQVHSRLANIVHDMSAYRSARLSLHTHLESAPTRMDKAGSEDEADTLLASIPHPDQENDEVREGVMGRDERREVLRRISQAVNETVKAGEEKMGLAATTYEWIDRHIRRLDGDIAKLESSILLGLRSGTEESRGAREALGLGIDVAADVAVEAESTGVSAEAESASLTKAAGARRSSRSQTTPKLAQAALANSPSPKPRSRSRSRSIPPSSSKPSRQRKPHPLSPQKGGRRSKQQTHTTGHALVAPDTSEMPYDPTEPTYCYCDQISFDEMVACDNPDCPIEWFHYACVGLTIPPKADWFCRFCSPPNWKGPGTQIPPNAKHIPPNKR